MTFVSGGQHENVCADCLDRRYTLCDDCNDYHWSDDVTKIDGRDVCDDCKADRYFECAECGDWFCNDESNSLDGYDGDVCDDCFEKIEAEKGETSDV